MLLVLDASKLEIQLPLFFQLKSAGFPILIVLTMVDILPKNPAVNISSLAELLKTTIQPIRGLTGEGLFDLAEKIRNFKFPPKYFIQEITDWNQNKFNEVLKKS